MLHVQAKAGTGSATLSMAYAAAKFAEQCLRGLSGETGIVECAYVASDVSLLSLIAFSQPRLETISNQLANGGF